MTVTRTISLSDLTPAELARLFCDLHSDQQAEFFNAVGEIAAGWPGPFCIQAHAIVTDPKLDGNGRKMLQALADHLNLEA